jgi:hypothetical protein
VVGTLCFEENDCTAFIGATSDNAYYIFSVGNVTTKDISQFGRFSPV